MKKILLSIAAVLTLLSTASYALASTAQFQVNTLSGGSLTTSLISYYPMSGNSNDYYGSNNGANHSVSYSTSYGKVNQGVSIPSSSGWIGLGNDLTTPGGNSLSYAVWIYPLDISAQSNCLKYVHPSAKHQPWNFLEESNG